MGKNIATIIGNLFVDIVMIIIAPIAVPYCIIWIKVTKTEERVETWSEAIYVVCSDYIESFKYNVE